MSVEWDRACFDHWQETVAKIGDSVDEHGMEDTVQFVELFIEDMNETLEGLNEKVGDLEAEYMFGSIVVVADLFCLSWWENPKVRQAAIDIFELLKGEVTLDTLHKSLDIMRQAAGTTLPI